MHPYRIILILLALFLFYYGYRGIKRGRIHVKGVYADKEENPFYFWLSVITIYVVGVMIFVLALVAKIE